MTEKQIRSEILNRVSELYEGPNLEQNSESSGMKEQRDNVKSIVSQVGTEERGQGARILLVDDQEANLVALEATLKDLNQGLVRAKSGQEALRLLLQQDFALILLDVRMPDMDGFETAELIRKRQKSRDTPIIFITAADSSSDQIVRGYRVGAVDFISKPLVPEVLTAKVGTFLELYKRTEKLRQSEERFRLLVESVKDYAIFMLGTDGSIVSWNLGAERISGYRQNEIVGKHISLFYPQEDVQAIMPGHAMQIAVAEGRFEGEGWRIRKDGSRFWANVVITPVRDEQGNLRGFAKVIRDITQLKEAERVLSELPARLLQSQDEERQRIAQELHDSTSPALAGAISRLYLLKDRAQHWDTKTSTALQDSLALAENVAREIRNLSERLHSRALEQTGFVSAVRSHAEVFGRQSGVRVELELPETSGRLPQNVEIVLFRILQEVLPYIRLHSNRQFAVIRFNSTRQEHTLELCDRPGKIEVDGSAPPERRKTALEIRLAGPGERIKQLGGSLSISTRSGIFVRAVVPASSNSLPSQDVGEKA
jgi:PAS domain S-box-containing protein